MFDPSPKPRLFSTPIGVDFGTALLRGLESRLEGAAPDAWARATIYVNTTRMRRHLMERFAEGPARLMPKVRLVTDLASDPRITGLSAAMSPLRMRLQLRQAVARLIALQPDLAPSASAFDLATSLAALLEEMQDEGVQPGDLAQLDVGEHSAHWARSLQLISILAGTPGNSFRGQAARNRDALESMLAMWEQAPSADPIIVAGSTGSRGTTRKLMEAVAALPQGAVVLPGVDAEMPDFVWNQLITSASAVSRAPEEDHPQYRFAALLEGLQLAPSDIRPWADLPGKSPARNRLLSLALRPAPVTDQWRRDGPALQGELPSATDSLTLIEAPTPRHEASAIALSLREAVESGKSAALVTPDRTLARQVTAALGRWGIVPDDSAGLPLHQSPPGRFLIETAGLFGKPLALAPALSLLKHPLTASSPDTRGLHQLCSGRFEIWARKNSVAQLDPSSFVAWVADMGDNKEEAQAWASWVADLLLSPHAAPGTADLEERLAAHLSLAEALAAGPGQPGAGGLWLKDAGEAARAAMAELQEVAPDGGDLAAHDYAALIRGFLAEGEVREAMIAHPLVSIWGTIEARTKVVDRAILAGLNEGTWPASLPQDPWMNRAMRREAGMLLPERRVGLAAHDFQQAMGATEVVLSRSARSTDAETVPSRWLNRLTNLLTGLGAEGQDALAAMRQRGANLLEMAEAVSHHLAQPVSALPAPRPSPAPPIEARPRKLFVTAISTLIRDPYAIYARHVLRLRQIGPRAPDADAALRGTVLHAVMEHALRNEFQFVGDPEERVAAFLALAEQVISARIPWPATRRLWLGRLAAVAPDLVRLEARWQAEGKPVVIEKTGTVTLQNANFTVAAKPDRIDSLGEGLCAVLDYKSSTRPPSEKEVEAFEKQLLIEAAIAEAGGFTKLGPAKALRVGYISLGNPGNSRDEPLEAEGIWRPDAMLHDLAALIRVYDDPKKGYTARRAPQHLKYASDYDHLSRYGEWDDTAPPETISVGQ
ncbi:double-strand break repair protein AddB [Vannielia litorea]|uniref:double-strand break repair protein AddB n=1 Tax=Vannielia litorea TaxID=1217970 RepID=UPI001BD1A481|nr:double-strand break repair protein AddB [Vannielia litorea]MBS8224877.1 double-strand break repair protein AddB [Vannielia litorea]